MISTRGFITRTSTTAATCVTKRQLLIRCKTTSSSSSANSSGGSGITGDRLVPEKPAWSVYSLLPTRDQVTTEKLAHDETLRLMALAHLELPSQSLPLVDTAKDGNSSASSNASSGGTRVDELCEAVGVLKHFVRHVQHYNGSNSLANSDAAVAVAEAAEAVIVQGAADSAHDAMIGPLRWLGQDQVFDVADIEAVDKHKANSAESACNANNNSNNSVVSGNSRRTFDSFIVAPSRTSSI